MLTPTYLDYSSTTPVDARVAKKMANYLTMEGDFGNAASRSHYFGWQAEKAVHEARSQVADLVGADPREIVWTSGATESNNLAIKGIAHFYQKRGKHIITLKTEHKAVLDTCRQLEREGFEVSYLDPLPDGLLDLDLLKKTIREDTILASFMHVNNEIGVIQDLQSIGDVCRANKVFFHVDAAQSAGKIEIDLTSLPVDLMSFSAHKIYGPKGMGALYVSRKPRVRLEAQIHGGGHEGGLRSGTLNVPGIVGFGVAAELAAKCRDDDAAKASGLVAELVARFEDQVPGVELIAADAPRLPNTINIRFKGADADAVMANAQEVSVSSGSACTSRVPAPSHVLVSMGMTHEDSAECLRFSVGRPTTREEIGTAVAALSAAIERVRDLTR